jgi:transcriptional regulator with XRE-family HTH domain
LSDDCMQAPACARCEDLLIQVLPVPPTTRTKRSTLPSMDRRSELREFLTTRRARITPDQTGLPWYGDNRRVPGLRREEVALLTGVSVDYYIRLERGTATGVSDEVLESLARALKLDEAERAHLFDLARSGTATPTRRRSNRQHVRPSVRRILDAMTGAPAFVRNGRMDLLAANQLGRTLYSVRFAEDGKPTNTARFVFLDPRAPDFYVDWEDVANDAVATLRSEAGRNPDDKRLSDLVGELSTKSDAFRTRWAAHNVRYHDRGTKRLHHQLVGELTLDFEAMDLSADTGLVMFAYTAEPGSKSAESLNLLATLAATEEPTPTSAPEAY